MRGKGRYGSVSTLLVHCLLAMQATGARADDGPSFCRTPLTAASLLASDASADLYNSILWSAGSGAIRLGADTSSRWSRRNAFDEGIRDGLREDSVSARKDAGLASDFLLGLSLAVPIATIGRAVYRRDCLEAYDMATDLLESVSLALLVTEAAKVVAGRDRPFVRSCDSSTAPTDAVCGGNTRFKSFFSGHASMAAASAGASCAFAIRRKAWGSSTGAQAFPCALGVGAALATGVLRVVSDSHWGSDVIVGLGAGAVIGYLDTWGPFDHLRFEVPSGDPARKAEGVLVPWAGPRQIGARIALRF